MFLIDVNSRPCLLGLVVVPLVFLMVALLEATVVGKGHRVRVLIIEDLINCFGWTRLKVSEFDVRLGRL